MADMPSAGKPYASWGRTTFVVPAALFFGLALLMYVQLYAGDPQKLPSALIGKPVPQFALPAIPGVMIDGRQAPGLSTADLTKGEPAVVNIWASWCVPCRAEHEILTGLSRRSDMNLVGINHRDRAQNASRFLQELGNPFRAIGADVNGRVSIDWGVYGVPETFIVDRQGRIAFKHIGPLTAEAVANKLLPTWRAVQRRTADENSKATPP